MNLRDLPRAPARLPSLLIEEVARLQGAVEALQTETRRARSGADLVARTLAVFALAFAAGQAAWIVWTVLR